MFVCVCVCVCVCVVLKIVMDYYYFRGSGGLGHIFSVQCNVADIRLWVVPNYASHAEHGLILEFREWTCNYCTIAVEFVSPSQARTGIHVSVYSNRLLPIQ